MKFVGTLLEAHLRRYPRMELADIYKLLHQAALGSGHAVRDAADAQARLQDEITTLGAGPAEPMIDPISPDGRLARIHLRVYRDAGQDVNKLAQAFVATANSYPPAPEKLAKFCGCLGDLAEQGGLPFSRAVVVTYFNAIAEESYPVVHHSEAFRAAYKPAYRVVDLQQLA